MLFYSTSLVIFISLFDYHSFIHYIGFKCLVYIYSTVFLFVLPHTNPSFFYRTRNSNRSVKRNSEEISEHSEIS